MNPDYQKPLAKRGDVCTDCASCEDIRCLGCTQCARPAPEVCTGPMWRCGCPACASARSSTWTACATSAATAPPSAPYDSCPYQDKFTLFWSADDFGRTAGTRASSA